ncbi:unnamed protein product [Didymodactylos carnosus]|uniref:EGF-like domain-containing protein n=1 Tax=Didymodactylos carnosus TaxID=1234261 RepID=A0A8S2DK38_9BILA|nr:unnamed protein product [Didymodactylos carnosus]CAF3691320.1 unnamed protein product [Didymodactylos carnosus]
MINDGRSHKIDIEFKPTLSLVIDDEEIVPLVFVNTDQDENDEHIESIKPTTVQFGKGSLDTTPQPMLGWLQDFRLNNHQIPLLNNNTEGGIKVAVKNISIICDFCGEVSRFGIATGTFDGNSNLLATLIFKYDNNTRTSAENHSLPHQIFDQLEFRLRARSQHSHLFTLKSERENISMSFYIRNTELIYKDSNIEIQLTNLNLSTTFRCQWSNNGSFQFLIKSGATFQLYRTISTNLLLNDIVNNGTKLYIGSDDNNNNKRSFRGCIDYILVGDVYVPFYSQQLLQNDTRTTRFVIDTMKNIQINNCTFDNACESNNCVNGTCRADFDTYRCECDRGFEGNDCSINIDECLTNNCTMNGVCIDQIGTYICRCYPGFTGVFCETNINDCIFDPCLHGGQCIDLVNSYMCNCTQDYIGFNCSISKNETCLGRSCENNGHCLSNNVYSSNPTTRCQCEAGFNGTYCEEDLCSILSCQNNGTCVRTENNASCLCLKQWYGSRCTMDVDECEVYGEQLCLHNGSCHNYPGTYECQCQENFLGENCERLHDCLAHNPCQNSGSCKPINDKFLCLCPTNYTGSTCELVTCDGMPCEHNGTCMPDLEKGFLCNCTDTGYEDSVCGTEIDECQSNPCFNNGTCIHSIGKYECKCQHPYTGKQCNIKSKFLSSFGFSYHLVIWPGVALLLLLIIILLTVTIRRIRQNRRSRGTYRPAIHENNSSRVEFSMILKPPQEERLI